MDIRGYNTSCVCPPVSTHTHDCTRPDGVQCSHRADCKKTTWWLSTSGLSSNGSAIVRHVSGGSGIPAIIVLLQSHSCLQNNEYPSSDLMR